MVDDTDIIPGMAIMPPAAPEALCEDEGCPHHGTPHICRIRVRSEDASLSFSDAPLTIGELRATKSKVAKDWAPRDVLISVLRRVDRGEINPSNVMVIWDDADTTSYTQATESKYRSNWLLDRVKRMIMKDEDE